MHDLALEPLRVQVTARILATCAILFIYVPPLCLLLVSFNPGILPSLPTLSHFSLKWYIALLDEPRMLSALRESVIAGLLTAALATLVALPAALAYMELRSGRAIWFNFVVFSMFVPGVIQGLALSVIFRTIGVKPSTWTIVAGHLLWALPFAFIVILTNLSMLKRNLILAARDLGASWWVTFRDIILPLIRPGIIGAVLFSFLLSFNEFNRAYYLVGAQDTLPIYMFGVMDAGTSPTIYSLAGSILLISLLGIGIAVLLGQHLSKR
jgi:spermidine/putrescine transport system permease protein